MVDDNYRPTVYATKEGRLYYENADFFSSPWFKNELERILNSEGFKIIEREIKENKKIKKK